MSAWDISHHMEPASVSTKEQENLIDYALKGKSASINYVNIIVNLS